MKERIRKMLLLTGIMYVMCFSVCACRDDKNVSTEQQGVDLNDYPGLG